jgi:hypothetical protein
MSKSICIEKSDGNLRYIPKWAIHEVIPPSQGKSLGRIKLVSGEIVTVSEEENLSYVYGFAFGT